MRTPPASPGSPHFTGQFLEIVLWPYLHAMDIKILCPLWGHEHVETGVFIDRVKAAGYHGLDAWIPEDRAARKTFLDQLEQNELLFIVQQHQAGGETFAAFKESFLHYLGLCAEARPMLINSHTGRDYFTFAQNLELIDLAANFSQREGIPVVHEIHRGRFTYHPSVLMEYMEVRPDLLLTADLSHWVCVTESMLENFTEPLGLAIGRARHVHARVGFEEGPQVPDPRAPEWETTTGRHLQWWDRIVEARRKKGAEMLTFTTEFGPPPYLPREPFTQRPVADQFEINCYMKDLLLQRYG
ncbi:MAG TPA: hypothetical protein VHW43_01230 [Puia sp.]|nr:hypothetical protein [Puia sp.]